MIELFEKNMFQEMKNIDNIKRKKKGITFTPLKTVQYMFNLINIKDIEPTKFKLLEPSVGKGIFILYYLNYLKINKKINKKNVEIVLNNIFAFDIEEEFINDLKEKILNLFKEYKNVKIKSILEKNIKCKNFLMENFNDLKFDLVIGNPPYVRVHNLNIETKLKLKEFKDIYNGLADLSIYFINKSFELLNKNGEVIFITSDRFTKGKYGYKFRKKFIDYLSYYENNSPFFDVKISTTIMKISKNKSKFFIYNKKKKEKEIKKNQGEEWDFSNKINLKYKTKFKEKNISISNGIVSGFLKAHKINEDIKNELIKKDNNLNKIIFPVLSGKDLSLDEDSYIIKDYIILAIKENIEIIEKSKVLLEWFQKYEKELKNRKCVKSNKLEKYYLLQSFQQPTNYTNNNYLTKRFGKLKFVKVPKNIYFLDTVYSLTFDENINIDIILNHLSKKDVLNDFYQKTNKFGNNYEIHKNKFENIKI